MGALHTYNTSPLRCGSVGLSLVKTWDLRLKGNEKEIRFEMKPDFSRIFFPLFSRSILFIRNCIFLERERNSLCSKSSEGCRLVCMHTRAPRQGKIGHDNKVLNCGGYFLFLYFWKLFFLFSSFFCR